MNLRYLRSTILSVLFLLAVVAVQAQLPREAAQAFNDGNFFRAMDLYGKLLEKEPKNPEYNYFMGISYLKTNVAPKKALDYLLKVEKSGNTSTELYMDIARAYMFHLQYEEAMVYLNKIEKSGKLSSKLKNDYARLRINTTAGQDLIKYPVNVTFTNLGEKINSEYPDYFPFITKAGDFMIFTSRRKLRPGSQPEFDGYYPSDIYQSTLNDGKWEPAMPLNDKINSIYDEQSVGLTDDGDTLFYYIDHIEDFGDIFMCIRENGDFTNPKRMDDKVNSGFTESACSVSKDGTTFIYSSNRKGGAGELDLWMTRRDANGKWGTPQNLGPEINTPLNEDFPTLSDDGQTLYFCSDGHPGMGSYDLFFSVWDAQSQVWSKPQNMGYPINTPSDEKTISFLNDGQSAVMSAFRPGGFGDIDLYTVRYQKTESDEPAVFLFNIPLKKGEILPKIEIRDQYDELVGDYVANKVTGTYLIALHPGKYFLYIDAQGYKPYTEALVVNRFHTRQDNNVKVIKLKK